MGTSAHRKGWSHRQDNSARRSRTCLRLTSPANLLVSWWYREACAVDIGRRKTGYALPGGKDGVALSGRCGGDKNACGELKRLTGLQVKAGCEPLEDSRRAQPSSHACLARRRLGQTDGCAAEWRNN